jgi:hypothetical protein
MAGTRFISAPKLCGSLASATFASYTLGRSAAPLRGHMNASVASIMLTGAMLGFLVLFASADDVPTLNMGPTCDAVGAGAITGGRDKQACMQEEDGARDLLTKNWSLYTPADKTLCRGMVSRGGPASYVELLSCLEIMKGAAAIHKAEPGEDVDSVNSIGRRRPQNRAPRSEYDDTGIRAPAAGPPARR